MQYHVLQVVLETHSIWAPQPLKTSSRNFYYKSSMMKWRKNCVFFFISPQCLFFYSFLGLSCTLHICSTSILLLICCAEKRQDIWVRIVRMRRGMGNKKLLENQGRVWGDKVKTIKRDNRVVGKMIWSGNHLAVKKILCIFSAESFMESNESPAHSVIRFSFDSIVWRGCTWEFFSSHTILVFHPTLLSSHSI